MKCPDTESLSGSDKVLLESILEWYNEDKDNVTNFLDIVKRKSGMSLRVIDWLVTNFSKTNSVDINCNGTFKDLNRDYQKNLSAFNKRNMDPFARRNKIKVVIYNGEERSTTVGQLNFFRWFYKNNVNLYLKENRHIVESHMRDCDGKDNSKGRGKRVFSVKSFSGKFTMTF